MEILGHFTLKLNWHCFRQFLSTYPRSLNTEPLDARGEANETPDDVLKHFY